MNSHQDPAPEQKAVNSGTDEGTQQRRSARFDYRKVILSLFLVFHLYAILLAPNKDTYLGMRSARWVEPYLNALELASPWNFFAPDPGSPQFYLEWEFLDQQGDIFARGVMPERKDPFVLRERQNRRISLARFMANSEERTEEIFAPYLCRTEPKAEAVRVWRVMYMTPLLGAVASGKVRIGEEEPAERRTLVHHFCRRGDVPIETAGLDRGSP